MNVKEIITVLKEHLFSLVIITTLTLLVCRNLLFSAGFPAGTDMLGWVAGVSYLSQNLNNFSIWVIRSFGAVETGNAIYVPLVVLNLFFHNSVLVVKIAILAIFLFSGLSMYFFMYHYTKKQTASLVSAILYMINPFFIGRWAEGHVNFLFAYSIAPLLFLTYDKALRSGKSTSIIASSLFLTLIIFARLDLVLYYGLFLVLFTILTITIPYDNIGRKTVLTHTLKTALIGGALTLSLNAFQFLPTLLGARSLAFPAVPTLTVQRLTTYSKEFFESLLGIPVAMGYISKVPPFKIYYPAFSPVQYYIIMSIPVILALSAQLFRRGRLTLFFTLTALTSVFLAKGPHQPFGEVYVWFWIHIYFFRPLSVPDRWLMITYLSYAFLFGASVNAICNRLKKFKTPHLRSASIRRIRKLTPQLFLILVIITPFLGNWYIVSNGLQTWHPPEQYIKPHLWIAKQPGEFMVATVPYYQSYMRTDMGNSHDFGFESSFLHGKRIARYQGTPLVGTDVNYFVAYTFNLMLSNGTDNLMKILGPFDIKYLVAQGYLPEYIPEGLPPTYQHYFISEQEGLKIVYTYENSTVYENQFWTPRIFASYNYAVVISGREAFTSLTTLDNFSLNDWVLLFADQVADQLGTDRLLELLNQASALIFVNSEPQDLVMLTLKNATRIRAADYAYPSQDATHHWVQSDQWIKMGMHVLSRQTLSTYGKVSVSIPISIDGKDNGEYEVWLRVLYHPNRGNLSVRIDEDNVGSIIPGATHDLGFKWIKIGSIWLDQGKHHLVLSNNKSLSGVANDIDEIVLVKHQDLKSTIERVLESMQESPAIVVHIMEGEQMFKWASTPHFYNWWPTKWPFKTSGGYVGATVYSPEEEQVAWIRLNYSILRSGHYSLTLRVATGLDYGTLKVVVDKERTYSVDLIPSETWEIGPTSITFRWITFDPLALEAGNHIFELYASGKVELDQIAIYSLNQGEEDATLQNVFKTDKPHATIAYETVNPTRYVVHVKTDTPFFLVFSDAYHNLWKAYVDGEEIESIPAYSFVNTFHITKTGEYDVTIEFIGQRYVIYGGIISIISITLTIIYLTFDSKINQFILRKLKLKQKREMKNDQ